MWRDDSLEKTLMLGKIESRRRRGKRDKMVGCHHWLNGHEFEQAPEDDEGQGSLACCSLWGCKESDTTERLNNNTIPFCVYATFCLFTHWWTLKLLPLRCSDSATVNISVQISVWVLAFRSLGYIPKHGIAGLYGNSMFKFWGTAMLCYTILHSHQQWREILFLHVLAPDSWCLQLIKVFVKVPCTVQAKPTLAIAWNCSALGNRLATSLWQNACSSISISKKWR